VALDARWLAGRRVLCLQFSILSDRIHVAVLQRNNVKEIAQALATSVFGLAEEGATVSVAADAASSSGSRWGPRVADTSSERRYRLGHTRLFLRQGVMAWCEDELERLLREDAELQEAQRLQLEREREEQLREAERKLQAAREAGAADAHVQHQREQERVSARHLDERRRHVASLSSLGAELATLERKEVSMQRAMEFALRTLRGETAVIEGERDEQVCRLGPDAHADIACPRWMLHW
jgi:hypothetical protein